MAPALARQGGWENKESGRASGESNEWQSKGHTRAHSHIIQLVALRSSLKVVARLHNCRIQFAHKPHTDSTFYHDEEKKISIQNQIHIWQPEQHFSSLSSFLFSGEKTEKIKATQNPNPLKSRVQHLRSWPIISEDFPQKHNRQSHRVQLFRNCSSSTCL